MRKLSQQRALIALKSFPTVKAAARSVGVSTSVLTRMAARDPKLAKAYDDCVSGAARKRQQEEEAAAKRRKEAEKGNVSVRIAEKRKMRFFAAVGKDPRVAAAALHKRLNHEERQDKAAALEEAIDAVDAMIAREPPKPITRKMVDVWDRWCRNCNEYRVDDPCEVCSRHTIEAK